MTDDEIKQLIASNAKSIEALSNAIAVDREVLSNAITIDREERRKEQTQLYQYLSRIAAAQSSFYEVQADYYHQLANLQERQSRIEETLTEILERVSKSN
jgi:hypothetical protein